MTRVFLLFFGLVIVASCSPPNREAPSNAEEEAGPVPELSNSDLLEEVMALHDAVMPDQATLRSLGNSLRELAESAEDQAAADLYTEQANLADSAFQSMMVWMRQFDPDYSGSDEEIKQYLEGQLKQMSDVKALMERSLEEGQKLVDAAK